MCAHVPGWRLKKTAASDYIPHPFLPPAPDLEQQIPLHPQGNLHTHVRGTQLEVRRSLKWTTYTHKMFTQTGKINNKQTQMHTHWGHGLAPPTHLSPTTAHSGPPPTSAVAARSTCNAAGNRSASTTNAMTHSGRRTASDTTCLCTAGCRKYLTCHTSDDKGSQRRKMRWTQCMGPNLQHTHSTHGGGGGTRAPHA